MVSKTAERLERRQSVVDEIAVLRTEQAAVPENQAAIEEAEEQVNSTWAEYVAAGQALAQARALDGAVVRDRRIDELEGELSASADKETIENFTNELDELHPKVRFGDYLRLPTNPKYRRGDGNGGMSTVAACLRQITKARREAATVVPLEALDSAALEARLAGLRDSILLPN